MPPMPGLDILGDLSAAPLLTIVLGTSTLAGGGGAPSITGSDGAAPDLAGAGGFWGDTETGLLWTNYGSDSVPDWDLSGPGVTLTDGSVTISPLRSLTFPSGTVTDDGGGSATYAPGSTAPSLADVLAVGASPNNQDIAGTANATNAGARLGVHNGDIASGEAYLDAGDGLTGQAAPGGKARLGGGDESDTASRGAYIETNGGGSQGTGIHGRAVIFTDDEYGEAGEFLAGGDAAGSLWQTLAEMGYQAGFVDPTTATPEAIANALIAAGLMAAS